MLVVLRDGETVQVKFRVGKPTEIKFLGSGQVFQTQADVSINLLEELYAKTTRKLDPGTEVESGAGEK